jgi:hypothetical protein
VVSKATQGFFADEDDAFEDPGTVLEYHENLNVGSSSPRPPSRSPTFDDILQPVSPQAAANLADQPEIATPTSRMKIDMREGQSEVSPIQQKPQWRSFIMKDPDEDRPDQGIEYNEFNQSMMVPGKDPSDHGVADEDNKVDCFMMDPSEESHQPDRELVEERNGVDQLLREWTTLYNDPPTLAATTPDEHK